MEGAAVGAATGPTAIASMVAQALRAFGACGASLTSLLRLPQRRSRSGAGTGVEAPSDDWKAVEPDVAAQPVAPQGPDDGRCVVLSSKPLMGQDKWLGGVGSFCGRFVYGVPGKARRVLRITLDTGAVDEIGEEFIGNFKWLRGAESPSDECLYCIPSNADRVLCINPATQTADQIGGTYPGDWKWHGGNLGDDGMIYGIPANAEQVLKVDPRTKEVTTFGGPFPGRQKWYGGLKASTGAIYGIPQNGRGVLKIDPSTGECRVLGDLGEGGWKYHGGVLAGDGSIIYGIPCNADNVLKIDAKTDTITTISHGLKSGRHRTDDKYKYLGGGVAADGKVYFFPADAERVLCVDPVTDEAKLVGPSFLRGCNKWQNGFAARDGRVYAIPQRAAGVLCIEPAPPGSGEDAKVSQLICGLEPGMVDKFEGGVMGGDGCIYCVPLRAKHVVKIVPGPAR